jgi:hypothetical protein
LSHVCYMPQLSRSPSFDLPNNIWQKQKSWSLPLSHKYSSTPCPQISSVFFSQYDRPRFIPI